MSNMYGSPAGPAGGPGPAGQPDPYAQHRPARDRKKRMLRWGIGITLAGFLAGGGIALAVSGGSNPAAAGSTVATSSQVQGTTLNSELNAASSTSSAMPVPRLRWALARLRALGGVDGEFTFHNRTGFHTLAFQRGAIQSVNGSTLVVRAPDGTTWTWQIVSTTVVRQSGHRIATNTLATGDSVFVGGPVINGAKDARLIVIRQGGSGPSSSSSVSGPSGTSVS